MQNFPSSYVLIVKQGNNPYLIATCDKWNRESGTLTWHLEIPAPLPSFFLFLLLRYGLGRDMSGADMTLFYSMTMSRETRGKKSSENSWMDFLQNQGIEKRVLLGLPSIAGCGSGGPTVVFCRMKTLSPRGGKLRKPCACWQLHSHSEESKRPRRPEGLLLAFNQAHLKGPEDPTTAFRELR